MSAAIRPAGVADLSSIVDLLVQDANDRNGTDNTLWKMHSDAPERLTATIKGAMENEAPPFRQQWFVAETGNAIVGVAHSVLLPVPPIYAGEFGSPGLIMEDCFVSSDAPSGTTQSLLQAAEDDLVTAGARILLGSAINGGAMETAFDERGYVPLTLYLSKTGLGEAERSDKVSAATQEDISDIVTFSAENRQVLHDLNRFWKPHPDADQRFQGWMEKSLTLPDRDMLVSKSGGAFRGYAISQPATPLHFPAAHDIGAVGIIDDYFHSEFADPERLGGTTAEDLLQAAESTLKNRGNNAVLIVCPAAWSSKIDLLKSAGYTPAITWFIKP